MKVPSIFLGLWIYFMLWLNCAPCQNSNDKVSQNVIVFGGPFIKAIKLNEVIRVSPHPI